MAGPDFFNQSDSFIIDVLRIDAALDVVVRTLFVKPSFLEKLFFRMHVTGLMKKYYC